MQKFKLGDVVEVIKPGSENRNQQYPVGTHVTIVACLRNIGDVIRYKVAKNNEGYSSLFNAAELKLISPANSSPVMEEEEKHPLLQTVPAFDLAKLKRGAGVYFIREKVGLFGFIKASDTLSLSICCIYGDATITAQEVKSGKTILHLLEKPVLGECEK